MLCTLGLSINANSQNEGSTDSLRARHSIFIEVGGPAFPLGMLNYVYSKPITDRLRIGARLGASYPFFGEPNSLLFPIEACVLYGGTNSVEVTAGRTLLYSFYDLGRGTSLVFDPLPATVYVGYRHEPPNGGFFFRFGATFQLTMGHTYDPDLSSYPRRSPLPGIGFGHTFR